MSPKKTRKETAALYAETNPPKSRKYTQNLEKKGSENVPILPRIQEKSVQGGDPP